MAPSNLSIDNKKKDFFAKPRDCIMDNKLRMDGFNEDITEKYFWHMNFAYYVGKGYTAIKLEDYHYFSEGSQYGANMRQMKGGSIRAFQENFQQLIQLIRAHLIPLLKEVKEAHFYETWFNKITENDEKIREELAKPNPDKEKLKKLRGERNEAINHMKDKWVNEVDMGRLWQMNRSQSEQGLDFALLPQLFFGINLDDPLQKNKTIKEQLDEDVYPVEVTYQAKEQVARFMYKFYTWLPTAIKDTEVTFKLKISALKNIYAQTQMYINFMKPLLVEINRKSEGFHDDSFYKNFDINNPEFVSLLDTSYSFVKVLGVRNFAKKDRGSNTMDDLEFTRAGLFISGGEVIAGDFKGKSGFLFGQEGDKYKFYPWSGDKNISSKDLKKLKDEWKQKPTYIFQVDLRSFPILELDFEQKRRTSIVNTQQGPQQMPYMRNGIRYRSYVWNIYEVASYREKLKEDNLELMDTFIEEISIIREDLMKYVNYFSSEDIEDSDEAPASSNSNSSSSKTKSDYTLLVGPIQGLYSLIDPLIPSFENKEKKEKSAKLSVNKVRDKAHLTTQLTILEDTWKVYRVFKISQRLISY